MSCSPESWLRALPLRALPLLALAVLAGCGGRRPPVPDVAGALPDVVVRAALAGAGAVQPLLLDSASFGRLGEAVGAAAFTADELARLVARPFRAVSPADVLVCPSREPCRIAEDAVYLEVWAAERTQDGLDVVVSRVGNVRGLHVMTRSDTRRLVLRPESGGWRLERLERLPS